ncbi:unnamed protein product [Didymodactylos carnosus]|uniref:SIR2-like domain-containing protein n=1 Tax=Didymodactylos carnosus TaxID=1234261 RepID=A0A814EN04_9BILA|nr:unnamed protein product [Didymodactylos carnosus]CAF0971516.1 unnamed protein product [Didymodactylos carnosus]CAF3691719.1 unnamed protein product [Didymodactylos carnosus]CAF3744534.1 unnamed protein product [Didymodactylos carnosus]
MTLLHEYRKLSVEQEELLASLRLTSFRSSPFVILCGTALSMNSGMPIAGIQHLVQQYTTAGDSDDNQNLHSAWELIKPHFQTGPPRIRFEAVFDIIQQYIDPSLSLLDVLNSGSTTPTKVHDALAILALTSTVVTTNFNHLIEDAGRSRCSSKAVPFDVLYTDEHFKNACISINNTISPPLKGLWKLHGTVAKWENNEWSLIRADEMGGPIVTLKLLSLTRESEERRLFLHHLLRTRPVLVVGYSGNDDFDVTRWLRSVDTPQHILWVQWMENCAEPLFYNGVDVANGIPDDISKFDRGLIGLVRAWALRGIADHLTIAATSDPNAILLAVAQLYGKVQIEKEATTTEGTEFSLPLPTKWQSCIVSGAMLAHLSYFSHAKRYFDLATETAVVGTREYCIAKLAGAEAAIEIGNRVDRIQAMYDAQDAAQTAPLRESSWATRKAQYLSAIVKRYVEKDGAAVAITLLQTLLDGCGRPTDDQEGRERNLALDVAMLLAQLRRFLPKSDEPSDLIKEWLEAVPKIGLLQTKGMNLHEVALNKYQMASNIVELDDALNIMKEAVEIREELGHMRGLVASLNVLGSMCMRRADWHFPSNETYVKDAADCFRQSLDYSDKHASEFDQFQARIHLAVCLIRYPSSAKTSDELPQLLNYFQRQRSPDDCRTKVESDFCLAMSVFVCPSVSINEACARCQNSFNEILANYEPSNDARLIRILGAARFNAELCQNWMNRQPHAPTFDLTKRITTRNASTVGNAYWDMRIKQAETLLPADVKEHLRLLLDPISP